MPFLDLPLADLESYVADTREPDDLDAFWRRTLADSRAAGGAVQVSPVETGLTAVTVDDVIFPGFAGDPVRAWLTRPAGATGALPVIVELVGYGGGRGMPHEHTLWATAGFAHLVMDTRGQGSAWGNGGATPDPHGSGPATPGYLTRGLESPEQHYYRRVVTDGVRAVDAVAQIEGLDASRVVVKGISQGGGLALGVAGLARGLCGVLADVPFLAAFERAVAITDERPYGELRQWLSVHRDGAAQALATLAYVDAANLGTRADAPALMSVALMDPVCPPSTVYTAYNRYAGPKEIDVYPYNGHEGGQQHRFPRQLAAVRRWVGPDQHAR
ncbi:cephalosporin-C deacetylase [Paraoerskovia marina]|uniref:Cephalosporin-C deacetylase n=1 Tax=Paraoerskovia marina TaxID=545619 RepID=A0A1H1MM04_9CELL|nr:acetylxylan esterase [Paraoerskovia marina]SDR87841.1 cephalosporin-C deacetylase [Paraoerskovia marina]